MWHVGDEPLKAGIPEIQDMLLWKNMENYPKIIPVTLLIWSIALKCYQISHNLNSLDICNVQLVALLLYRIYLSVRYKFPISRMITTN